MGISMGSVDMVITIGRWSLAVMGPGLVYVFTVVCLFVIIMSGAVALFGLRNVGKCGPMCLASVSCISSFKWRPVKLVSLFLNAGCLALKSAIIMDCLSTLSILKKSGVYMYPVRGGMYVVLMSSGPVFVCTVIVSASVS